MGALRSGPRRGRKIVPPRRAVPRWPCCRNDGLLDRSR
jgi:hypothetical protein